MELVNTHCHCVYSGHGMRISMGRYTTEADIAAFEKALKKVLNW